MRRHGLEWMGLALVLGCGDAATTGGKVDAGRPPIPRDVGPGVTMDAAAPGGEDAALQGPDGPIEPDDAQVEDVGAPPAEDAALPETDVKPTDEDAALPDEDAVPPGEDAALPEDAAPPPLDAAPPPLDAAPPPLDAAPPPLDAAPPPVDAALPPVDAAPPPVDAAPPPVDAAPDNPVPAILVTDLDTDTIHALDARGAPLDAWPAPNGRVRGVAHDRRAFDGFWIVEERAPLGFTKLDWDGLVVDAQVIDGIAAQGSAPRGLDFWPDPTGEANDRLVVVALNSNRIDVTLHIRVSDGGREIESSFAPNFAAGYWGVHASVDGTLVQGADFERLLTRPMTGMVELQRSVALVRSWALPVDVDVRGISRVGPARVAIADARGDAILFLDLDSGLIVDRIETPGISPSGLSFRDAVR
ncbi:MAG: hypothetical protein ACOYM9_09800 [Bradymonadia bacterium]